MNLKFEDEAAFTFCLEALDLDRETLSSAKPDQMQKMIAEALEHKKNERSDEEVFLREFDMEIGEDVVSVKMPTIQQEKKFKQEFSKSLSRVLGELDFGNASEDQLVKMLIPYLISEFDDDLLKLMIAWQPELKPFIDNPETRHIVIDQSIQFVECVLVPFVKKKMTLMKKIFGMVNQH